MIAEKSLHFSRNVVKNSEMAAMILIEECRRLLRAHTEARFLADLLRRLGRQIAEMRDHKETVSYPEVWQEYIDAIQSLGISRANAELLKLAHDLKVMNHQNKKLNSDWMDTRAVMDHYCNVRLGTLPELEKAISKAEARERRWWWCCWIAISAIVLGLLLAVGTLAHTAFSSVICGT